MWLIEAIIKVDQLLCEYYVDSEGISVGTPPIIYLYTV